MTVETLSKQKVIDFLKQSKVNVAEMEKNERLYLYSQGRNILAEILLIEVACGNLDAKEKE